MTASRDACATRKMRDWRYSNSARGVCLADSRRLWRWRRRTAREKCLFGNGEIAVSHVLAQFGIVEHVADLLDHVVGDVTIHGDRLEPDSGSMSSM